MLRNAFIVFITGWISWFWIDKPHTGLDRFLQTDDSLLVNFQRAFELLKSGFIEQSFVFIWNAHYVLLSLIGGVMVSLMSGFISDYLARKRMKSQINIPSSKTETQQNQKPTEQSMD